MNKIASKIKLSKLQKILIFGSTGLILIGAVLLIILYFASKKPIIAFYRVPENVQNSVIEILNTEQTAKKEKKFDSLILDSTSPLSLQTKQIKKADLLISLNDYDVQNFISEYKKINNLPADLLDNMPSATISTIPVNENVCKYVPFLYDFYEIDINYPNFIESQISNINLWSDLINYSLVLKEKIKNPVLICGAEDETFINTFGMILETLYGYEELQKLEDSLYQAFKKDLSANSTNNEALSRTLDELTTGDTALNNTMLAIIKLIYSGVLPRNYTDYVEKDNTYFMESNECTAVFTSLSIHRKIKYSILKNYKSIYSPSAYPTQERKFQAPQMTVAVLNKNMIDYAKTLCETKQLDLCAKTGLAPVNKSCATPDIQSSDVRYWLAASSGPIMPLSASVPSENARKYLAKFLRENASF